MKKHQHQFIGDLFDDETIVCALCGKRVNKNFEAKKQEQNFAFPDSMTGLMY